MHYVHYACGMIYLCAPSGVPDAMLRCAPPQCQDQLNPANLSWPSGTVTCCPSHCVMQHCVPQRCSALRLCNRLRLHDASSHPATHLSILSTSQQSSIWRRAVPRCDAVLQSTQALPAVCVSCDFTPRPTASCHDPPAPRARCGCRAAPWPTCRRCERRTPAAAAIAAAAPHRLRRLQLHLHRVSDLHAWIKHSSH